MTSTGDGDGDGDGDVDAGGCDGVVDCNGVCNGGAVEDCSGVCGGDFEENVCGQCLAPGSACIVLMPDSETATCVDVNNIEVACPVDPQGQDGNVRISVPNYTIADGTVTDGITGLVWELNPDGDYAHSIFQDARTRCEDLTLAGQDDWRLPTLLELVSLTDGGKRGPAWPTVFPGIPSNSFFWSGTGEAAVANQNYVIGTNFDINDVRPHDSAGGGSGDLLTRCVRGTGYTGELVVSGATIVDPRTNLIWESGVAPAAINWPQALARCENLTLEGLSDWRLPNIKELYSIVDETETGPAISTLFAARPNVSFWSSTPIAGSNDAYVVNFNKGTGQLNVETTTLQQVRCVHNRE